MDTNKYAEEILNIVDKRIDKHFKDAKLIVEYVGIVKSVGGNQTAQVQLLGYDTIFTFPYRDYLTKIKIGDSVKIQCRYGSLSGGVIVDRFYGE